MSGDDIDAGKEDVFEGAGNDFGTSDQHAPAKDDEQHKGFHD